MLARPPVGLLLSCRINVRNHVLMIDWQRGWNNKVALNITVLLNNGHS